MAGPLALRSNTQCAATTMLAGMKDSAVRSIAV